MEANDVAVDDPLPCRTDVGKQSNEQNCFICWRRCELEPLYLKSNHHRRHPGRKVSEAQVTNNNGAAAGSTENKQASALNSQLSVILLLRKILGLHQDVLTKLLENCNGDGPGDWGIKLCGSCHVLFREAEFVHKRLIKFQADFEYLAKEIREILLASAPAGDSCENVEMVGVAGDVNSKHAGPIKRKGKRGRPASKKGKFAARNKEGDTFERKETAVENLRKKFIECSKSKSLDITPPNILFTCQGGGSSTTLDGIQTTQPIQVKLKVTTQDFLNASGVVSISLDKTPTKASQVSAPNLTPQPKGPADQQCDQYEAVCAPIIKREIFAEAEDHNLGHDELVDFDDAGSPPSPPPLIPEGDPLDPEWAPEDDDDNDAADNIEVEEENERERDSDYEPPTKKKDKRFTRKKPNVKVNERKKELRNIKAMSIGKVPAGATVEPVKGETDNTFGCPHEGCGLSFLKKFDCHVHVLKDHFDDPMPYHCHVCDSKRFLKESIFRKHMYRFHQGAKNPYEDDYDPELHSEAKLKSLVSQDEVWKSFITARDSEHSSDEEGVPGVPTIPDEILEKFKDSPDMEYPCRFPPCKKKYFNEMLRDGHEKQIHQGIEKPYSCDLCHRTFIRRGRLLEHITIVHFSNQHACNQCGARFADKVLLAGHIGRAHLGDKYPFKCTQCRQQFIRRTKMDMHMFKKHGIPLPRKNGRKKIPARKIPIPKLYPDRAKKGLEGEEDAPVVPKKCWMCASEDGKPMLFDTPEDMKEHNEKNHIKPDIVKPFKCPLAQCRKEYRTHGTLDYHVMNVHNGQVLEYVPGEYKCFHCDEDFHRSYHLDAHMARAHDVSMYICNFCAKQFRTQRYMEDHQRQIHYKEMKIDPLKCKYCGKIMNTKKSLDHHIKIVHMNQSAFKCSFPGCTFGSMYESSLKTHQQIKHSNKKHAICHVCSRTFAAHFYLNRHMLIHTGEKPYKCRECGKDYSDLSTFNRHKEAHLGIVHKCPLASCGKEYNTRHAFRIHLKQHQAKGIHVEIPKIRYQTEEEDEKGQRLLEGKSDGEEEVEKTKVDSGGDGDVVTEYKFSEGLPVLEAEDGYGCSNIVGCSRDSSVYHNNDNESVQFPVLDASV